VAPTFSSTTSLALESTIRRNPKVALNFDGDGRGGDIVVLSGTAEVDESRPSPAENTAWIAKYASECQRSG